MDQILKNTFLLGCGLLFVISCWLLSEIFKTTLLVSAITNPGTSIQQGVSDAQTDFARRHAHFQRTFTAGEGWSYPGILEEEIQGKYKNYAPNHLWCSRGFHFKNIGIDLHNPKSNDHYAIAYNLELIKMLQQTKNI